MLTTALFEIARNWKQPRCPKIEEWVKKMWYIYTMKYLLSYWKKKTLGNLCANGWN